MHFVLLEEEDYLEGLVEFAQINAADLLVLPAAKGNLVNQLGSKEYLKTKASHQQIPLMLYGQPVAGNCSAHCAVCAP